MAYSEADVLTKLKTRRDAIVDELAALATTTAGGKPNSTQGGIDHVGYKKSLYDELAMLREQIAQFSDPFEVIVEAASG
ncbi:MAG: hypothetical protein WC655_29850 [Candidatus Hydrogenedentales bacterium]|jgi:hypothetical protein